MFTFQYKTFPSVQQGYHEWHVQTRHYLTMISSVSIKTQESDLWNFAYIKLHKSCFKLWHFWIRTSVRKKHLFEQLFFRRYIMSSSNGKCKKSSRVRPSSSLWAKYYLFSLTDCNFSVAIKVFSLHSTKIINISAGYRLLLERFRQCRSIRQSWSFF